MNPAGAPPPITVLMGVHDAAGYLESAIRSILDQTLTHFHFLIIDDGSTDGTPGILAAHARRDARIRILTNPENLNLSRTLNLGLAHVASPYVARMDGDDLAHPQRLARQLAFMESHPEVGILGTACTLIDEWGKPGWIRRNPEDDLEIQWHARFHNPFNHPTVMLRRQVLEAHNLRYAPDVPVAQDFQLWQRLLPHTRGANLPDPLMRIRIHPQRTSNRQARHQRHTADRLVQAELNGLHPERTSPFTLEEAQAMRRFFLAPTRGFRQQLMPANLRRVRDYWILFQRFAREQRQRHPYDPTTDNALKHLRRQVIRHLIRSVVG